MLLQCRSSSPFPASTSPGYDHIKLLRVLSVRARENNAVVWSFGGILQQTKSSGHCADKPIVLGAGLRQAADTREADAVAIGRPHRLEDQYGTHRNLWGPRDRPRQSFHVPATDHQIHPLSRKNGQFTLSQAQLPIANLDNGSPRLMSLA